MHSTTGHISSIIPRKHDQSCTQVLQSTRSRLGGGSSDSALTAGETRDLRQRYGAEPHDKISGVGNAPFNRVCARVAWSGVARCNM